MSVTPQYSHIAPDGSAAGGIGVPVEGNDGQIWTMEHPGTLELIYAPKGLGSGGILVPSGWSSATLDAFYARQLIDDGAGNLWAFALSTSGHHGWAYYNPATTASGFVDLGSASANISYNICLGPAGDIWGASLADTIHRYTPFSAGQTTYTFSGSPTFAAVCSDGVNCYAQDNAGTNSALWVIDSSGNGTKFTPALSGLTQGWCIGPDGNIWTSALSGTTTLLIYKISTGGSLLATYTITIPSGGSVSGAITGPDGNVWFSGAGILVSVTTSGASFVWSLKTSGTAVINTLGTFDGADLCSASDGNIYLAGTTSPTTFMSIVEAMIANTMRIIGII